MVPYVRKSFLKHYLDGLAWVDGLSEQDIEKEKAAHTPAESSPIDGDWNYKSSYNYAMEMTKKETSQAVEAMYHNLK